MPQAEFAGTLDEAQKNYKDQTWRDVAMVTEESRDKGTKQSKTKGDINHVSARLAFVQEGLLTLYKQSMGGHAKSENDDLESVDNPSLWTAEQSNQVFAQLLPFMDNLLGNYTLQ